MPSKPVMDITGQRYGKLTVLRLGERTKTNRVRWWCRCECGVELQAQANNLRSGNTSSCGCENQRKRAERAVVMGRLPNRTKPDDEIGYTAAHDRVRRVRGSASGHACVDCGGRAQDWSLKSDCSRARPAAGGRNAGALISPFPEDYEPRCRKCHAAQDGHAGWGWNTWRAR